MLSANLVGVIHAAELRSQSRRRTVRSSELITDDVAVPGGVFRWYLTKKALQRLSGGMHVSVAQCFLILATIPARDHVCAGPKCHPPAPGAHRALCACCARAVGKVGF